MKVVALSGIRIRLSSFRIERGQMAWARVDGLMDDETPFAFGGAVHPLHITWTVIDDEIIELSSPLAVHYFIFSHFITLFFSLFSFFFHFSFSLSLFYLSQKL